MNCTLLLGTVNLSRSQNISPLCAVLKVPDSIAVSPSTWQNLIFHSERWHRLCTITHSWGPLRLIWSLSLKRRKASYSISVHRFPSSIKFSSCFRSQQRMLLMIRIREQMHVGQNKYYLCAAHITNVLLCLNNFLSIFDHWFVICTVHYISNLSMTSSIHKDDDISQLPQTKHN